MTEPGNHPLLARLQARRARHLERGLAFRLAFGAAGFVVLAAGIAMLVLPGPGLLVAAIGLAMLALEFAWAEWVLVRTVHRLERTKRAATRASRLRQVLALLTIACAAAAVVLAALHWDLPLLPF